MACFLSSGSAIKLLLITLVLVQFSPKVSPKRTCNNVGVKERVDPCLMHFRRIVKSNVSSIGNADGEEVCRTEIQPRFEVCSASQSCSTSDKIRTACQNDDKVAVQQSWQYFNKKTQTCTFHNETYRKPCIQANSCPNQRGDVIIMMEEFHDGHLIGSLVYTMRYLVNALNIGPNGVRVGIYTFFRHFWTPYAPLRDGLTKGELFKRVRKIRIQSSNKPPDTSVILERAKEIFSREGRPGVNKFAILISGRKSRNEHATVEALVALKEAGVTMFVLGAGDEAKNELTAMTAPMTDTNMVKIDRQRHMVYSAMKLSARLCIEMSPTNAKLCDEKVSLQMTSPCMGKNLQVRSYADFKYDSAKNCVKHTKTKLMRNCVDVCNDPITGSQYITGESWSTACHEFRCDKNWNVVNEKPPNQACPGINSSCHPVGSAPFRCLDLDGNEVDNCQCIGKNGRAVLVIEQKQN